MNAQPKIQRSEIDIMADRINKWITILIGSVILLSGSTATVIWQAAHNHSDIEYVRSNAANKKSVDAMRKAFELNNESIEKLVNDPDKRDAVKFFNDGMKRILDEIVSWNSTIEPRGTKTETRLNIVGSTHSTHNGNILSIK